MTAVPGSERRGMKHLAPIIKARMKLREEYGPDYPDKPVRRSLFFGCSRVIYGLQNDMLSWLMDEAAKHNEEGNIVALTQRVLTLNMAAVHTTSMVL